MTEVRVPQVRWIAGSVCAWVRYIPDDRVSFTAEAVLWSGVDIGRALGFGGGRGGGNLTRDVRGRYKRILKPGPHYMSLTDARAKGKIWLTYTGVLVLLALVIDDQPKRAEKLKRFLRAFA